MSGGPFASVSFRWLGDHQRNLLKIRRVPDILVFTLIQPIMFVLLFTYVYGRGH